MFFNTHYHNNFNLNSSLDKKSNTDHIHDDRYYTETEIDSKLGKLVSSEYQACTFDTINSFVEATATQIDKPFMFRFNGGSWLPKRGWARCIVAYQNYWGSSYSLDGSILLYDDSGEVYYGWISGTKSANNVNVSWTKIMRCGLTDTVITSSNIGSQSVNYSGSAGQLTNGDYNRVHVRSYTGTPGNNIDKSGMFMQCDFTNGCVNVGIDGLGAVGVNRAAKADSVAWSNISNKPSSYTPSSHTHDDRYIISGQSGSGYTKVDHINKIANDNRILFSCNGGSTSYTASVTSYSDERVKKNIYDTSVDGLSKINSIKLHEFDFIDDKYGQHSDCGYIAQELQKVCAECVIDVPHIKNELGYNSLYQVDDTKLIPYLVKAVQELSIKVNELESK